MIKLILKNFIISFFALVFLNTSVNSSLPDFTILAEEYSSSVVNVSVERKQKEKENQSDQMRRFLFLGHELHEGELRPRSAVWGLPAEGRRA